MSASELGCSYAAMILHDDGLSVTGEKIATMLKAANLTVESYWPSLFAKLCEKRNVEDLVMNVGAGSGTAAIAAPVAGSAGGSAATASTAVEEKKEEPRDESDDDDFVFGLFD